MSQTQRNLPLIVIGILLVFAGVVVEVLALPAFMGMTRGAVCVVVPGSEELELSDVGDYTIFHETVSLVDGQRYTSSASLRDDMIVELFHAESGVIVDVEATAPLSRYTRGDNFRGESAFRFEIDEPGVYTMHVNYASGAEEPKTVLSVTSWSPFSGGLVMQLVIGMVLLFGGISVVYRGSGSIRPAEGRHASNFVYEHRVDYSGSAEAAFEVAEKTLLPLGFEIDYEGSDTFEANGPGMRSTKQPPLNGVTHFHFTIGSKQIRLCAELGGVRKMRNFLYTFIPGMAILFVVMFGAMSIGGAFPPSMVLGVLAPFAPWVFIGPIMVRWIRGRTTTAIDTLMNNMAKAKR